MKTIAKYAASKVFSLSGGREGCLRIERKKTYVLPDDKRL